ncbi:16S rRNA (guanine1207-N2)-methyltransferase [Brevibacterium sanguinis]|uniref:16S rRNA (Guanine1207-N2)-methyltransferase n=2 Tax=Brevibacterium TaxID=1696 RepID=A0A366IN70_9MICO|nr:MULTISPECIES: methyltransferase [Brevibacterium]RBP68059.1 16S rRNA (guanine1207-N2)-methyltransferase [Brevibacterium sanguinis]RBP74524.1 16S rRNA (guanine1207-N2)-methyltransferase [Brevibacterium celere]
MPATLLAPDSAAADHVRDLLAARLGSTAIPGIAPARFLAEYVLGRRDGELDISGRPADGQFIPEALAALPRDIVLVDDPQGVQARVLAGLATLHTYNDRIDEARTVAQAAPEAEVIDDLAGLKAPRSSGETWAVVNAPKAVSALAEVLARLQPHVSVLVVIGRSDAMSRAVNKELARGFARVDVSPGAGKHRLIIGSRPLSSPSLAELPAHGVIDHPSVGPLQVRAHGACFSGVKNDEGSALLLDVLAAEANAVAVGGADPHPTAGLRRRSVLDLGCGNGWLLTAAMRVTQAASGLGVDVSRAAVASARATAEANGTDVDFRLIDAAADPAEADAVIDGVFDLILLNPPFHHGTAIESDTAAAMMRAAARYLAPGGEVLTVFNSHLRYRERLERLIGPSRQAERNAKFTVIASRTAD